MNKEKIVLEIPHQRPASAWIAYDGDATIIEMAHHHADNTGCYGYDRYTPEELLDCYGDAPPKDAMQALLETDGFIYEIDGMWLTEEDAPSEIDWACETLGHDLSSFQVLENDNDLSWCLENLSHQRDKAEIELEKCRALVEWESTK